MVGFVCREPLEAMVNWRRIINGIFLLAFLLGSGCAGKQETFEPFGLKVKNQAVLRVGMTGDYPPLSFSSNGSVDGLEADMAKLVAYDLNRKIVFHTLDREKLIPALRSRSVDVIMAGMSITPARQALVRFVQPYMRIGQMALVRKSDAAAFKNPDSVLDFTGRTGYLADTTGANLVLGSFKRATPVALQSVDQAVAQLRNRQIDLFIHDAPTIWRIAGNTAEMQLTGLFWPLTTEYLAWAVRTEDEELAELLNASLSKMKQNGSLNALIKRRIPLRVDITQPAEVGNSQDLTAIPR